MRHPKLGGWHAWMMRRRRELRIAGVRMSDAGVIALHEARVRIRIGRVLGRPAAKKVEVQAFHNLLDGPMFVLTKTPDEVTEEQAKALRNIPSLLSPAPPV